MVAFNTGGLPDMIDHGQTGYLAKPFSVGDFAKGVKLTIENRGEWAPAVVEKARHLYAPKRHVRSLLDIYQKVIKCC